MDPLFIVFIIAFFAFLIFLVTRRASTSTSSSSSFSSHTPPEKINKFTIRHRKSKYKTLISTNEGPAILIEGKGLLPVIDKTHIGSIVTVSDNTDGNSLPIISSVSNFRQEGTTHFQDESDLGNVAPGDT